MLNGVEGHLNSGLFNPKLQPWTLNLRVFNHESFNPGLFNHEFLNHGVEKLMIKKSGVENSRLKCQISRRLKEILNPDRLFKYKLCNHMVQKSMVEKSRVETFMVGKSAVERSGLKLGVDNSGVEMFFNLKCCLV